MSGWTDRAAAGDPSPRAASAMAYNRDFYQVVLFGGAYIDPLPCGQTCVCVNDAWSLTP